MQVYKIEPVHYTITLRATHIKERYPLAFASIEIEETNGEKVGKLVGMIRRQEFKKQGICKDLILERIKICQALHCDKVYTAVYYKRKGLIKIYKQLGFRELEPITPEYVRLEKDLEFNIIKWAEELKEGACALNEALEKSKN
jgi:hypothetical protein